MTGPFLSPFWHRVSRLRPKLRSHTRVARHRYRSGAWYVLRDESTGRHYRFSPASYLAIGLMDGERTVDAIWKEAMDRLGDDAPSQSDVVDLLAGLHAADLIQCEVQPDIAEVFHRFGRHSRAVLFQKLLNPNAFKWPLLDPDAFLDRTFFLVRPFFGRLGLAVWLAAVIPALVLVALHFRELTGNVADRLFASGTLLTLALVVPVIKLFHELGHAYAVKSLGGAVHEAGLMVVVFAPMPYVDSSAASLERSKWRRAGVGAAGMLVETFIAALATFVWVSAEPSLTRSVAATVMLVAGVTTLVFNLNPLLRYDGYFILADLLEIPNLAQRASKYWGRLVETRLFGLDDDGPSPTPGERIVFLLYGPLALAYRMLVLFGIALLVATQYFHFGVLIALWGIVTGLVLPALRMAWQVASSPRLASRRRRAVAVSLVGVALALGVATLVPLPLSTTSEGVFWLPEDAIVRAGSDGFVQSLPVAPGTAVQAGDVVIRLSLPEALSEARVIAAQVEGLQARLQAEAFSNLVQADLTRAELRIRESSRDRLRDRIADLDVRAARAGTFVAPREADLEGRFARRGEILGYVIAPATPEVRLVVDQSDVDLLRTRLRSVSVVQAGLPDRPVGARIVRQAPAASNSLPSRALAVEGGGTVPTDQRSGESEKALQGVFVIDVALDRHEGPPAFGARAFVRFDLGAEPLAAQAWRRIRQVFLARLHA